MDEIKTRYYEIIKRTSDTMQVVLNGAQINHSELVEEASFMLTRTLKNVSLRNQEEYQQILDAVVDMYEVEVGIKTFAPNILNNDKSTTYWLSKAKSTTPHSYFDRYKLYLRQEGFPMKVISNIEYSCERILSSCANPKSASGYDKKKGLVVGDVQSGKTANYLGLINMAYDYGYKIVVLLAGGTKSLRVQTQKRTDAGVIGAKSDTIGNVIEYIGVGIPNQDHFAVPFTNQNNDFKKFIQNNLNASIGDFNKPVILVVKKVKSILESVGDRLQSELTQKGLDSKSILIIDDEADYASPNTAKPENDPTTINRLIRTIFNKFPIASYVGFTATPFANVFINPFDQDESFLDLFPSDFIVQLNSSDQYFGGRKVFPKEETTPRCLRILKESEKDFFPVKHDQYTPYLAIPESLKEAIHEFLINCVIRTIRGDGKKHRSMMINITVYNLVQYGILSQITNYLEKLSNEIEQLSSSPLDSFLKNKDMAAIYTHFTEDSFYRDIREPSLGMELPITWEKIQAGLYDEIKQFRTVVVNSKNGNMDLLGAEGKKKRFDYADYEEVGARVIAIGGMVLSRGLTLEGLMTSYYSRNAGTYDTLLQMCRWFGYRPGYEDLCRVYLTQENVDRFDAVLQAVEDLKEQFAEMERQGKKPKDFGLMIKESPDSLETTMLVTARNKMRGTEQIEFRLSYGGVYADTSKLSKKASVNKDNIDSFINFYRRVPFSWTNDQRFFMAEGVSQADIADLIQNLKIPYVNRKFDTDGLSEYIRSSRIFPTWDVVIATGNSKNIPEFMGVEGLRGVVRSFHTNSREDYIRIGGSNNRVLEPSIFDAGLNVDSVKRADILAAKDELDPSNAPHTDLSAKDYLKLRNKPILVIYPIDLKLTDPCSDVERDARNGISANTPLLAFAVGFPNKESDEKVVYRANLIKLAQLSDIEVDDDEGEAENEDD